MDETRKQAFFAALFRRGLGEFPMLRRVGDEARIGVLAMNKGKLVFKDRAILQDVPFSNVAPCWDLGLVGALADLQGQEWQSLSFLGVNRCEIKADLSSTRHDVLGRIVSGTGDNILDFKGSVYRGFRLLLDAGLLPIVLPLPIGTQERVMGLAVADFRFATVPLDALIRVNDLVRHVTDEQVELDVHEVDMDEAEFDALFDQFRHAQGAQSPA